MGEETRSSTNPDAQSPQAAQAGAPVQAGAAEGAPTAPHATLRQHRHRRSKKRTGPERFWDRRGVRNVFAIAFLASIGLHYALGPWSLLPEQKLDFVDVEGELSIPVDLIEDQPPEEPPPSEPTPANPEAPGAGAATAKPRNANGEDASAHDAAADAPEDAGASDAESITDAEGDASPAMAMLEAGANALADAALAERGDAGAAVSKTHDPDALVGAASDVQAGPPLVRLFVNMEEIRKNPAGVQIGPLLSAIPQWDEFMSGTQVDPVRDTDWVYITGPSLIHSERDVILVHYSASDKLVDHAIDVVAKKYASGGLFDAGVPGVKASLGHADRAARVFLRPQTRVLAVVPPDYANTAARTLVKARVSAHARPGEAMRLTLRTPHRPMPFIPESISEMRLWITPRSDGGAEVFGEGDTPDRGSAAAAGDALRKVLRQQNSIAVRLVTQNLLGTVEITEQGSMVRLHGPVSREQLDAILGLVAGQLGVSLPSDPARGAQPGAPHSQSKH